MADGLNVTTSIEIFPDALIEAADPFISTITEEILDDAKSRIGETYSGHHPDRGHLADSGTINPIGTSAYEIVFSSIDPKTGYDIASVHHDGARAHTFPAKDPKSPKPFYARRGPGGYTFGPRRGPFDHPGTDGNPFLLEAAAERGDLRASGGLLRGPGRLASQFRPKRGFFK